MTKYHHNKEVRECYPYGSVDELPTMAPINQSNDTFSYVQSYNDHLLKLKSYPLTSPIKGLKDGEVAEENVHFKIEKSPQQRVVKYGGIPSHVETWELIVAIPLTKEEPLPMEEETQDGLWEELMLLIISPMQLGEIQKKFHITRK